jgi:hypothetical protein
MFGSVVIIIAVIILSVAFCVHTAWRISKTGKYVYYKNKNLKINLEGFAEIGGPKDAPAIKGNSKIDIPIEKEDDP